MATLYIKKMPDGYFEFIVNGDTANKISNTRNDLTAIGTELHFKTANGANLVQNQQIYPEDCTLDVGGTIYTFTSVEDAFSDLKSVGFFDWMQGDGTGGGGGGVNKFEDLLDTFDYAGNNGKTVRVNETLQRLDPVEYRLVKKFTDLDDTPTSLSPDKMIITNPDGSAIIFKDLPVEPPQFLNSVGSFRYQDLFTITGLLPISPGVDTVIINDASGPKTNLSNNPYGVSTVYIPEENIFDFSNLSVGDTLDLRIDFTVRTTANNQSFNVSAIIAEGSTNEERKYFGFETVKTSGPNDFSYSIPFDILNDDVKNNPAKLLFKSDNSCDISRINYYIEIIRTNINITQVIAIPNSLQEVTEVGNTTTLPIKIGDTSDFIQIDKDKLRSKIAQHAIAYDVFLPYPSVQGTPLTLVSGEQLNGAMDEAQSYTDAGDASTLSSANSYTDSKIAAIPPGFTGSGTANKLAKFTGANAVGDSKIIDDGSLVTMDAVVMINKGFKYTNALNVTGFDLNNQNDAGFYSGNNLGNAPGGSTASFYIEIQRYSINDTNVLQRATSFIGNVTFQRTKESGVWTSWKQIGLGAKTRKDVSGSYTIINSDVDKVLYLAAGTVVTVPSGLTANQEYETFQWAAGTSSFVSSGTTFKMLDYAAASTYGQNARVFISNVDPETYNLSGDLSMI